TTSLTCILSEHRRKQVAKSTESTDIEIGERAGTGLARSRGSIAAWTRCASTKARHSAKCTKTAHVVVLFPFFGVAQHVVRFGNFLEALCSLWIVLVRVRVILLGKSAILFLDFICR